MIIIKSSAIHRGGYGLYRFIAFMPGGRDSWRLVSFPLFNSTKINFASSVSFFVIYDFFLIYYLNLIIFQEKNINMFDPDQAGRFVSPGLGENCLQRFSN